MRIVNLFAIVVASVGMSGCADRVVFVTSSSIGLNLDTTPATASIAFDREEGFIGPRYDNGAIPPVVASIQTDGAIIEPHIRQLYATGPAAVTATGGVATASPPTLSGDKKVAFIGTTSTLGLKVGFGSAGLESLNFGYKRKEYSVIPVGTTGTGTNSQDTYPSAIASIDTTTTAATVQGASLTTSQFIATGAAADALANTDAVKGVFQTKAAAATQNAAGVADAQLQTSNVQAVTNYVAPGGTLDTAKLGSLVDSANSKAPGKVPATIKQATSVSDLQSKLTFDQIAAKSLKAALP